MAEKLKLLAQDADDLVLISAALQDAQVKLADISYAPAARTVTFPLTRRRWEADGREQVSCAVQFGDVMNVRAGPWSSWRTPSRRAATCCCCSPAAAS